MLFWVPFQSLLNFGTLGVSKSGEVLQEDRKKGKVMCTLDRDGDKKEKHGLLLQLPAEHTILSPTQLR